MRESEAVIFQPHKPGLPRFGGLFRFYCLLEHANEQFITLAVGVIIKRHGSEITMGL